ncbi:MAG: NYN domain-containing protein [Candidatus Pacebacteria bacterium]|nr:NYN domain-containing protein [Candidatus Paceibacterota bacterium]MCF7857527.1 NYN domain-containing protein [Candidatus Paceibacterota bacterium]
MGNTAYIDGQNLFMGTTKRDPSWKVDLLKLRVYLEKKYHVSKAYYYLGFVQNGEQFESLYEEIQSAGFILVFREHNSAMLGKKKGNVDSDIIFSVMKRMYRKEKFDKLILVSGDGDYKMMVDFLIEENKLEKVLFPDGKRASSLYKKITRKYFDDLSNEGVKKKIEKEKGALGN